MNAEIRRYLKSEVDRLQKVRFECDRRLRIAWGLACHACGGDVDEVSQGCKPCQERARSRRRRAQVIVLPPGDPRHGMNGYNNFRCRCEICRGARAATERRRYHERLATA